MLPDLHPVEAPPSLTFYYRHPWGAYLTLCKCVRHIEGLWTRQTLMQQGVGEGRAPAPTRASLPGSPHPARPPLFSWAPSQSHGTLGSSPQGHWVPSEGKEPSEVQRARGDSSNFARWSHGGRGVWGLQTPGEVEGPRGSHFSCPGVWIGLACPSLEDAAWGWGPGGGWG